MYQLCRTLIHRTHIIEHGARLFHDPCFMIHETMHDFLLAKEIVDELKKIAQEKGLEKINSVELEIGQIALAHDGYDEHVEDISVENLQFGLTSLAKGTIFESAKFNINKIQGDHWKIVGVEGK